MAGRGLGTLTLDLVTRIGGFTGPLDKAGRDLDRRMKTMERRATAFGKVIGASLVAGATAFGFAVKAAIDQADQLNEISKKIGIPTDVLSGLNYAAKLSGVATEELQAGLVKMIKFQADAAKGGKQASKTFQTLGIAIKDASGNLRDSAAVFGDFAEIFRQLPDGPEKAALAVQVFGRAGAELIPLLNEGKSGIAGMADELDRLGGTVTPEAAAQADAFNDNIDKLKTAFGGLALQVGTQLLPSLIELTDQLVEMTKEGTAAGEIANFIGSEFVGAAADIRATADEIRVIRKLWNEQGLVGDGILQTLSDAQTAREALAAKSASQPKGFGRGIRGGGGRGFSYQGKRSGYADMVGDLFTPAAKEGGAKHKAAVDQVAQAYERLKAQMAETIALYGQTTEVAKLRYDLENGELAKLSQAKKDELLLQAQKIDQLNAEKELAEQRKKLMEEEEREIAAHRDSVKQLLDDIAFETSLMGLNNDERERMIALRGLNGEATAEEAAQIEAAMLKLQSTRKANDEMASAMDEFRGNFSDAVTDVLTGAKSITDAFKDLADQVVAQIARMIANSLTESLFGEAGSTGGGSAGGWLSSLFGAFMPKHASGTDFAPGGPSLVGERGPEIVNLPRGSQVIPNHRLRGGGGNINITIQGGSDPRETAIQAGREVRRVLAFSGRG